MVEIKYLNNICLACLLLISFICAFAVPLLTRDILCNGFPIFWLWAYIEKAIPETRRVHQIRYLCFIIQTDAHDHEIQATRSMGLCDMSMIICSNIFLFLQRTVRLSDKIPWNQWGIAQYSEGSEVRTVICFPKVQMLRSSFVDWHLVEH